MLYEITFPDGRKELRCKIGLAEQAAITTALQFRERLVVTITPEPSIGPRRWPSGRSKDDRESAPIP
jgi:hypothetical protein